MAVVFVAVALVAEVNVVVGVEAVEKLTTEMVEEWLNKKEIVHYNLWREGAVTGISPGYTCYGKTCQISIMQLHV